MSGTTGFLKETYPHYTCGKGFSRWLEEYNRYSTDEAKETIRQLSRGQINWKALFGGKSEVERRHALKDYLCAFRAGRWFGLFTCIFSWVAAGMVEPGLPGVCFKLSMNI